MKDMRMAKLERELSRRLDSEKKNKKVYSAISIDPHDSTLSCFNLAHRCPCRAHLRRPYDGEDEEARKL